MVVVVVVVVCLLCIVIKAPFTCKCFDIHYYLPYDVQRVVVMRGE